MCLLSLICTRPRRSFDAKKKHSPLLQNNKIPDQNFQRLYFSKHFNISTKTQISSRWCCPAWLTGAQSLNSWRCKDRVKMFRRSHCFLLVSTTMQRMSQTSPTEIKLLPLSGHLFQPGLGNPASLLVYLLYLIVHTCFPWRN